MTVIVTGQLALPGVMNDGPGDEVGLEKYSRLMVLREPGTGKIDTGSGTLNNFQIEEELCPNVLLAYSS